MDCFSNILIVFIVVALCASRAFGIIERFTLVITREILPGTSRFQVAVNGTIPGPPISVILGNTVQVKVINYVFDDSTSIHWHGMEMRNNPWMDGIIGITQCPISNNPGNNTMIYEFTPTSPGTFWYHGHYHSQYPDGKTIFLSAFDFFR
jgi:FtsP/CotA-like multicopper oxidase with cupredoxin domain